MSVEAHRLDHRPQALHERRLNDERLDARRSAPGLERARRAQHLARQTKDARGVQAAGLLAEVPLRAGLGRRRVPEQERAVPVEQQHADREPAEELLERKAGDALALALAEPLERRRDVRLERLEEREVASLERPSAALSYEQERASVARAVEPDERARGAKARRRRRCARRGAEIRQLRKQDHLGPLLLPRLVEAHEPFGEVAVVGAEEPPSKATAGSPGKALSTSTANEGPIRSLNKPRSARYACSGAGDACRATKPGPSMSSFGVTPKRGLRVLPRCGTSASRQRAKPFCSPAARHEVRQDNARSRRSALIRTRAVTLLLWR